MVEWIPVPVTNVFWRNFRSKAKIVVNSGGARSSKSYSVLQLFAYKCLTESNKVFLVTRKSFPALKRTSYKDFIDILKKWEVYDKRAHSREQGNHFIRVGTNVVHFFSIDDANKLRSFKCNYAFFEEANDFEFDDFLQVYLRTNAPTKTRKFMATAKSDVKRGQTIDFDEQGRAHAKKFSLFYALNDAKEGERLGVEEILEPNQIFLALNPDEERNYIWDEIVAKFPNLPENPIAVDVIESTHLDNPFLDQAYRQSLEATKHFNPEYYQVYALGKRASLKGLIHPDYQDLNAPMPPDERFKSICFGVDFGASAPTCVVKVGFASGEGEKPLAFIDEWVYEPNLSTQRLIEIIKSKFRSKAERLATFYCDSAEPDRIEMMREAGIDAVPAKVAKRDMVFAWEIVNAHKLLLADSAVNVKNEIRQYVRVKDKNGKLIDKEVPSVPNHAMAAMRYAISEARASIFERDKLMITASSLRELEQKTRQTARISDEKWQTLGFDFFRSGEREAKGEERETRSEEREAKSAERETRSEERALEKNMLPFGEITYLPTKKVGTPKSIVSESRRQR